MAADVALTTSPANVLKSIRGEIVDAQLGYPDVLQLRIRDRQGRIWTLATQDADYSPREPQQLRGLSIEDARIELPAMTLHFRLSGGSEFEVKPDRSQTVEGDPPYWELLTPHGQVLQFGPGLHWQINEADRPAVSRR